MRRSPPGKPHQEEEWPTLFPEAPTTPGTLQEMARQGGLQSAVISNFKEQKEPLSARTSTESKIPTLPRRPFKSDVQTSSGQSIERKPVQKNNIRNLQGSSQAKPFATTASSSNLIRAANSDQDLRALRSQERVNGIKVSPSVAPAQRSLAKLHGTGQTRASSLRAQASAARCATEGPSPNSQVIDFAKSDRITDKPLPKIQERHQEGQPRTSSSSPAAALPVNDVQGHFRPRVVGLPATSTVRSRRAEIHLRMSSRTPSPARSVRPITKLAPGAPNISGRKAAVIDAKDQASQPVTLMDRKSSIPVPRRYAYELVREGGTHTNIVAEELSTNERQVNSTGLDASVDKITTGPSVATERVEEPKASELPNTPSVSDYLTNSPNTTGLEEQSNAGNAVEEPKASELPNTPSFSDYLTDSPNTTGFEEQSNAGNAVEEPQEGQVRIKRLSRLSPENGPVLRISPSAERFIMGHTPRKDSETAASLKNGKDLRRAVGIKELRKASFGSESARIRLKQTARGRPSSAAGSLQLTSSQVMMDSKTRERKALSADAAYSLPNSNGAEDIMCHSDSELGTSDIVVHGTSDPFSNVKCHIDGTATPQDPDARLQPEHIGVKEGAHDVAKVVRSAEEEYDEVTVIEQPAVSQEVLEDASTTYSPPIVPLRTSSGKVEPAAPASSPVTEQGDASVFEGDSIIDQYLLEPRSYVPRQPDGRRITRKETVHFEEELAEEKVSINQMLSQPHVPTLSTECHVRHSPIRKPEDHPPRNSSRAHVQDYTTARYRAAPAPNKHVDPRLSRDFQPIQDKLGLAKGVPSTRIDPEASRSRRVSTAHNSNKTQGSLSKGMLSNFRGLFHKCSSDTLRSNKTGKGVTIPKPTCPFPHVTDVHPIHRPIRHRKVGSTTRPATPERLWGLRGRTGPSSQNSPASCDSSITDDVTKKLIDSFMKAAPGPRRDQLQELSNIMVEAVTNARDAFKAMEEARQAAEEAKHAARKAEVSSMLSHKTAADIARYLEEHRDLME